MSTRKNSMFKENDHKKLLDQISHLTYEESLQELDIILRQLQNDDIMISELENNYLKATLYLEHCENLLSKTEQNIVEIDEN